MARHRSRFPVPPSFVAAVAALSLSLCPPIAFPATAHAAPRPLRVVMDDNYPPYVFRNADNVLEGILVDRWLLWSRITGREAEIVATDWGKALRRMEAGEFDVIDTIFRTPERERFLDFSPPYVRIDVPIFFHEELSGIRSPSDLRGFVVAAKRGDAAVDVLRSHGVSSILEFGSYEALVGAARDGKVKVFVVDRPPAHYFLHRMGIADRFRETEPAYAGEFHRAVRKGDAATLHAVVDGFSRIPPSSLERIDRRWMGAPVGHELSPRVLRWTGGAVLLLSCAAAAWVVALRRSVTARTAELRSEIAERALAEERLRQSEERYRLLVENQADLVVQLDLEGKFLFVNRAYREAFGKTTEELAGKPFFSAVHEGDREAAERAMEGLFRPPYRAAVEQRALTRAGWRWFAWVATALRDGEGEVAGVLGIGRDVTDRKEIEIALRESEERFRRLFDSCPLGIHAYRLEEDGRLVFTGANPAADRILGVENRAFVGRTLEECFPPLVHTTVPEGYRRVCRTGEEWYSEQVEYSDGRIRGAYEVFAFQTAPGSVAVMFEDVTSRKREEALREKLEGELRQAQKMEAIGRLAGGVAHDFNNLLTAILGYGELLAREIPPGSRARKDLEAVRSAGEMAASLTRRLLAFSRKQILSPRVVELSEVVGEVQKMVGRLLGEDIELAVRAGEEAGCVLADPAQIQQVIMNLVVNARDAMPAGGTLSIETRRAEVGPSEAAGTYGMTPGSYVLLTVADSGCGMDEETRSRLFEPFFTTKEAGHGTGLGLSTVHGIVTQSGGHIRVDSEPGKGTVFRIWFPRVEPAPAEEGGTAPSSASLPRGDETVLVAEDSPDVRDLTGRMLSLLGYRVLSAAGGEEALILSRSTPEEIHLLLTDVVMPGMGGRELAEALSAERPGIRVAYTSGHTEDAIVDHGALLPGIRLLKKPFHLDELASFVRDVLSGGKT